MEKVCPLCNALDTVRKKCPQCGSVMLDGGSLNNYLGPYSPYVDSVALPFQDQKCCVHLMYCPVCKYDARVILTLVTI